jgi:hypothetical protein
MLPDNAKTIEIICLFKRQGAPFGKHFWKMHVKTQVGFNDGPGMNWSKFKYKFEPGNSIHK